MKAALYRGNGKFSVTEASPAPLAPGMVQLKVAYCGVCGTDVHIFHGKMDHRVKAPQVIGHEVSGEVAAVAPDVQGFAVGDRVAVRPLRPGPEDPVDNGQRHIGKNLQFIGIDSPGGMQSFWNVPAYTLHHLPPGLSLEWGALIEPLAVACHDVRLSKLRREEQVVVIGGGPIGMLIAMVAAHAGARVLLSEPNEVRRKLAASLGFDVVDPVAEDPEDKLRSLSGGAMADVVFEVSGTRAGVEVMTRLARVRGRIVMVAIHSEPAPTNLFHFFWKELQMVGARVYEPEDFERAIELAASGVLPLDKMITGIFPLDDVQSVFETIDRQPDGLKYMIKLDA